MAYLNKIDINGRTYYLQHLTDGKYEAILPAMTKDSNIIIQDASTSGNVGDVDKPVYIKNNKITACNKTIGNPYTPVYVEYGKIKPLSEDIGSAVNPIYMQAGTITESTETVGSGIVPIYMQDGTLTRSIDTVGANIKPIYMHEGTITESNANVGSEIIPVYMVDGTITQTTKTVGSGIKPIYMNGGTITASASTVGAINQPIYMNNGEITVCSDNVGSAGVPVYMENGAITACDTLPISSGGTNAKTPEEALANFGLTATAAELNTLDGITATVTELNYVDGVTSNIQVQFDNQSKALSDEIKNREDDVKEEEERAKKVEDNHESRILTMEAFFKEADIDASQEFIDTLKEIQTYISEDQTGATKMAESIKGNKDAIDVLNGDSSTVGSVAKAVDDAKTALEFEINKKVDKIDGKGLSANNYSDAEKEKLEGIETGANKYIHPSYNACTSGLYKITVDEFGHVSNVVAVSKDDIVGLGIPAQDTTYGVAVATTETENGVDGLLSAADKAKYDNYINMIAALQNEIDELKKLVE